MYRYKVTIKGRNAGIEELAQIFGPMAADVPVGMTMRVTVRYGWFRGRITLVFEGNRDQVEAAQATMRRITSKLV